MNNKIKTYLHFRNLPEASSVDQEIYNVINDQGLTKTPFWLGGDYYPKGMYQSLKGTWDYVGTTSYKTIEQNNILMEQEMYAFAIIMG